METTIRGIPEQEIESLTHPKVLGKYIQRFQVSFPQKSTEDSLFGFIVGAILGRFMSLNKMMGREFTEAEIKEFWTMMEKRTLEIKGKIKLVLGK